MATKTPVKRTSVKSGRKPVVKAPNLQVALYKGLQKLLENQYLLDYDADYTYCDGSCYDICRCKRIENLQVESVYVKELVEAAFSLVNTYRKASGLVELDKDLDLYCLERIMVHEKIGDIGSWELSTFRGYYGEEVNGASFSNSSELIDSVITFAKISTLESRIELALKTEYGATLPIHVDATYKIQEINIADLVFPNPMHASKAAVEKCYMDGKIHGLVEEKNGKYSTIDGYHRLMALSSDPTLQAKKGKVTVVVLTKETDVLAESLEEKAEVEKEPEISEKLKKLSILEINSLEKDTRELLKSILAEKTSRKISDKAKKAFAG